MFRKMPGITRSQSRTMGSESPPGICREYSNASSRSKLISHVVMEAWGWDSPWQKQCSSCTVDVSGRKVKKAKGAHLHFFSPPGRPSLFRLPQVHLWSNYKSFSKSRIDQGKPKNKCEILKLEFA